MSGPWDDYAPQDAGPWNDYAPQQRSVTQEVGRQVGLAGRAVVNAAASLPLAAMEFGAGATNLAKRALGQDSNVSFQRTWDQGLNEVLPQPESGLEKGVQIAGSVVAGSKIPMVTGGAAAPAGFKTAKEATAAAMASKVNAAHDAGFVVPPSTSNPSATAKTLEGMAGKLTTAQIMSVKNTQNATRLASRAIGLSEDAPLTTEAIRAVRSEAGAAYDTVRGAGTVTLGPNFNAALNAATAATEGANKSFPGLAKNPALDRIAALRVPQADASDVVDAIKVLRDYSDEAGASGAKALAGTYRKVATALENALDQHLAQSGKSGAVAAFRAARELIAKTYTVERAFNASTGEVSAAKLGQALGKGKPMSGELRQVGQFAQSFPKAARTFNESLPGISPLDFYASGGIAGMSKEPTFLLYPFVRQGIRSALATPFGQRLAVPSQGGPINPEVAAGLMQTNSLLRQ